MIDLRPSFAQPGRALSMRSMRSVRSACPWSALSVLLVLAAASPAQASGFTDIGQDIESEAETTVRFSGALRARFELLYNLDLDRGLSPSGQALFPVPLSDPDAQTLTHADMRLRTDIALIVPAASVAIKIRLDGLDNLSLGSQPDGVPSVAVSQRDAREPIRIKRAYGEVLTPFGLLAFGRMGNHWGLGMLANGGDCASCDSGDAADRIAFLTPLLGHVWAISYDFTATGPSTPRNHPRRAVDLDPWDDVRTVTFAVLDFHSDVARRRRARAGKTSFEYGAYVSHRWQDRDVPAHYLSVSTPVAIDGAQVTPRDFRATAVDVWARLTLPTGRIELEAAYLGARIGQPSLIPGVELRDASFEHEGRNVEAIACRPIDMDAANDAAEGVPHPALLLIPGYSRSARDYVPLAVRLAKMGVASLAVTQPGFGRSDGPPDFVGPFTMEVVGAGFDRLRSMEGVDPSRVGVFGYSRGAMAASLLATRRDDLACAIFGAGIYDMQALYPEIQLEGIRENVDLETGGASPEALRERSSLHAMDRLACPVLILHGARDINTPVTQAQMLRDRLEELDKDWQLRVYDDRDHDIGRENLNEAMQEFLARTILSQPE